MKLGLQLGSMATQPPAETAEIVREAERLGFDSMWSAEAYGADCLTPLGWFGSATTTLKLGTAVAQISARPPAATAMAAMTLDHLSQGRFQLGLGVSGPQVVEGWYGQHFDRPLARTREYVEIVRKIISRKEPVFYDGQFYELPVRGGTGLGKSLVSTLHPLREQIPILLGAEGPRNVALAAEIADGWLAAHFSPRASVTYEQALLEGFGRRPGGRPENFEVAATVPVAIDHDIDRARDRIRPHLALYIGGMGAKDANFHFNVYARMGFEEACMKIQRLYLDGEKRAAASAIPAELIDSVALVGPIEKIRDDLGSWMQTPITTLLIKGDKGVLRSMADAISQAG